MRPFVATVDGYEAGLDAVERQVIASLVADVVQLLGSEVTAEPVPGRTEQLDDASPLGLTTPPRRTEPPEDPAVRRLLPDVSGDAEVAGEFRRLTEDDLRRTKVERLVAFWHLLQDPGATLTVRRKQGAELAATLTDVRLVLADRLDLTDDGRVDALYAELEQAEDAAEDPAGQPPDPWVMVRRHLGAVYAALTFLQESLLTVMLAEMPVDPGRGSVAEHPGPGD